MFFRSISLSFFVSTVSFALPSTPILDADAETMAIPAGKKHSDDSVLWYNSAHPEQSLILGTSKYGKNAQGGLGVYTLNGEQRQFLAGSKLNSVDILQNLAVASNRSERSVDFFTIREGEVQQSGRAPLLDQNGQSIEPYGLCLVPGLADSFSIYLPTKDGSLHHYRSSTQAPYSISWVETISLGSLVTAEQDKKISDIVRKAALAEDEAEELDQALAERFVLEACVYDAKSQALYVGMENLGIWTIDLSPRLASPELLLTVGGSWTDFSSWYQPGQARITDDIEGMDILYRGGRAYLIFSSQGISEFSAFDLQEKRWIGNFKIKFGKSDPVTITDGLSIHSGPVGADYPQGLMIVHDDRNTSDDGSIQNANYKFLGLQKVWDALGLN